MTERFKSNFIQPRYGNLLKAKSADQALTPNYGYYFGSACPAGLTWVAKWVAVTSWQYGNPRRYLVLWHVQSHPVPVSQNSRTVNCPRCAKPVRWGPESPFRPFCSERCKVIDLGAWASEEYRVAVKGKNEDPDERSAGSEHDAP